MNSPEQLSAPKLPTLEMRFSSMSFTRNAEIYREDEPADYLYKVVSCSVRTYKVFDDGRR